MTGQDAYQVAAAHDLVALALRGGASVVDSLASVADELPEELGRPLRAAASAHRWGVEDPWEGLPASWRGLGAALHVAEMAGVPPAELVMSAGEDLRRAELERLERAAAELPVKLVLPLGCCFLPAFLIGVVVPVVAALAGGLLVVR